MTDIVTYRAPGSAVGSPEVQFSFSEQLREELEAIDPDLIFTFGNRAWNPIRDELAAEPVENLAIDESRITELHGSLHETGRVLDTYVLPLGHMSTQFYGAQISKQEYIVRMEDGLERWRLETGD
jgi:uracil-DNA glycosylase